MPEADGPDWAVENFTCTARLALLEAQRAAAKNRDRGTNNADARLWIVKPRKR